MAEPAQKKAKIEHQRANMGAWCGRRARPLPSEVRPEDLPTTVFLPDQQGIPRAHRGVRFVVPPPEPHYESEHRAGPDAAAGPQHP